MKLPEMTKVESTHLAAIGYDDKLGLVVRFTGGGVYHYPEAGRGVFDSAFQAVEKGQSIGRWFSTAVRGKYSHGKIDD